MLFSLAIDPDAAAPKYDEADTILVNANDADEAILIAQARAPSARSVWGAATITEVPSADAEGWNFRIQIVDSDAELGLGVVFNENYTVQPGDTFAIAISNLHVQLENASPASPYTQVLDEMVWDEVSLSLLIDDGSNSIGNWMVTFVATPPSGLFPAGYDEFDSMGLVESIHDQNLTGDSLSITFKLDLILPARLFFCQSR
jgi:hypothetical protein